MVTIVLAVLLALSLVGCWYGIKKTKDNAYAKVRAALTQANSQGKSQDVLVDYEDGLFIFAVFADVAFERLSVSDAERAVSSYVKDKVESMVEDISA